MPNLIERGVFPPACCHFCANPTRLVDLERETASVGRAYLCQSCLREAGAVIGFVPKDDVADLARRNAEAQAQLVEMERHATGLATELSAARELVERQERELVHLRSERSSTSSLFEQLRRDIGRWRREVAPQELLETHEVEAREREAFARAMAAKPDEDEEDEHAHAHDHETKRRPRAGAGKEA
jgi:hypothetical protein